MMSETILTAISRCRRHWVCRAFVLAGLYIGLLGSTACVEDAHNSDRMIAMAESFALDAIVSSQKKIPIVVFVSQHECEYCAALRKHVLFPMLRSGELGEQLIFREISLDAGFSVRHFDGVETSGKAFAEDYRATITPTLLFLDSNGAEIADRIVGISNLEYYSFYLNKSIESASVRISAGR